MNTRNFPYGYGMEKGRIVVIEEEAAQIIRIFEMRLDGVGVYAIGKMLYDEQIPFFIDTRDKAIKKVSAILYKPIYTGAKGYPAIIDNEVFSKVQEMKAAPFRQKKPVEDKNEESEEYEMIENETTVKMREKIMLMLRSKNSDSDQVRQMILRFVQEKYNNITRKGNTS